MKYKAFFKNAAILTVTSLLLRTAGIFFRVWMADSIGAEGMGLYQLIVSVYVLASTFATCGICTAVTRLVSELPCGSPEIKKVMSRATILTLIIAFFSVAIIYCFAEPIAKYLLFDMRAVPAIKILGLGLPFMGLSSVMRGYFLGVRKTAAQSTGQLVEQFFRMIIIVWLVGKVAHLGLEFTSAAILLGDGLSEGIGCAFLYIFYRIDRKKQKSALKPKMAVTKKMLHIAVPITTGRYIHTTLRTVENLLVPSRLGVFSKDRTGALELFGMLKGMAMPLLFFPASFLAAFSALLIPEISEAMAQGRMGRVRKATEKSIGITVTAATLIGGIFLICGKEVAALMYHSPETGMLICALAPLVPFMYLESVCDGILKGLDQQKHSFCYGIIDSASRIVLIWFFVAKFGITAFLLIMVYSNLLTSLLNIRRLLKVTETPVNFKRWIIFPLIAVSLGCVAGGIAMHNLSSEVMRLLVGGGVTAAVYLLFMFFTGQLKIIDEIF